MPIRNITKTGSYIEGSVATLDFKFCQENRIIQKKMFHHKRKIERVPYPEHPNRCQGIVPAQGQCLLFASEGCKYCAFHGGHSQDTANVQNSLFKYRLERFQNRIDAVQDSSSLKSLREEIALVRFLTQKLLDFGKDNLLQFSAPISALMDQARELSLASAKIEHSLEEVVEFDNAVVIAKQLLSQLINHNQIQEIYDSIVEVLEKFSRSENGTSEAGTMYEFKRWGGEITKFISKEKIVSIRAEISVLRILVEEHINTCNDIQDFYYKLGPIKDLISKIMSFVLSCHKLEDSMGLMLNKAEAQLFAQELIRILGTFLSEEELKRIKL